MSAWNAPNGMTIKGTRKNESLKRFKTHGKIISITNNRPLQSGQAGYRLGGVEQNP